MVAALADDAAAIIEAALGQTYPDVPPAAAERFNAMADKAPLHYVVGAWRPEDAKHFFFTSGSLRLPADELRPGRVGGDPAGPIPRPPRARGSAGAQPAGGGLSTRRVISRPVAARGNAPLRGRMPRERRTGDRDDRAPQTWSRQKKDQAPARCIPACPPVWWPLRFTCGAGHVHQERVGPIKGEAIRVYHEAGRERWTSSAGVRPRSVTKPGHAPGHQLPPVCDGLRRMGPGGAPVVPHHAL